MTDPSSLFGRSGLSDAQLDEMWRHMREVYPSACERLANPPADEEESKESTSFIHTYVRGHHGVDGDWRQQNHVYCDLLDYYRRQRLARVQERGSIASHADYWLVKNSLSCHPERLDADQIQQLTSLLSAYEASQPNLQR